MTTATITLDDLRQLTELRIASYEMLKLINTWIRQYPDMRKELESALIRVHVRPGFGDRSDAVLNRLAKDLGIQTEEDPTKH